MTASRPVVSRPQVNGAVGVWKVGDRANHRKWGIGTVVSVRGEGDDQELDIAFPSPIGIKRLLAKFAPIEKV
jgi:DNA helicase-2/ATP-dependent DNA helicase PcrA